MAYVVLVRVRDDHAVYRPTRLHPVQPFDVGQCADLNQARDVEGRIPLIEVLPLQIKTLSKVQEDSPATRLQQYLGAPDLAEATVEGQFDRQTNSLLLSNCE